MYTIYAVWEMIKEARWWDILKVGIMPTLALLLITVMVEPEITDGLAFYYNEWLEWTQDLITILFQQTIVYYII